MRIPIVQNRPNRGKEIRKSEEERSKMKKMKKLVMCILVVMSVSCMVVGCRHVATEKDVEKAYKKMEAGKISQTEYFEIQDSYINGDPLPGGGFFATVGNLVVICAVGAGVVVVVKKYKEKK